jgi:hypothetical protein
MPVASSARNVGERASILGLESGVLLAYEIVF